MIHRQNYDLSLLGRICLQYYKRQILTTASILLVIMHYYGLGATTDWAMDMYKRNGVVLQNNIVVDVKKMYMSIIYILWTAEMELELDRFVIM